MALLEQMHVDGKAYTFARLRDFAEKEAGIVGEGVVGDAAGLKVIQRAAGSNMSVDIGAGSAWVKMDTGTLNGLYYQVNDATYNAAVTAAHATLPRIDQVVLQNNDANVSGASSIPELKVLAGTPTSGATLANRSGAAVVGNDRIVLADILVPAASAAVVTANIRDRRPWARGAKGFAYASGFTGTTSTTPVVVPNTAFRLETAGGPVDMEVSVTANMTGGAQAYYAVFVDGVAFGADIPAATGAVFHSVHGKLRAALAAGSHVIDLRQRVSSGGTLNSYNAYLYATENPYSSNDPN